MMMACALRACIGCIACAECHEYKIGAVECIRVEIQKKYAVCAKNNNPKRQEGVRKKSEQQRVAIVKPLK